ncbi:ankyrin repeat domain-containing protein [archaeon]|nr:ankyrin repeat domain-containing protein [archaeon]
MTKDFKVNNNASLSPGEVKEILDACNRQFKNSKGKEDSQEGIKIFKKYFNKDNPRFDINKPLPGQGDWNALAFTTYFNKIEESKFLMQLGADSNNKLSGNISLVSVAARDGKAALCLYYLKNGSNVDGASDDGMTPMMRACEAGHMDVVQVMIPFKPNIMLKDNKAKTCLDYGLMNGHYPIVRYIEYFYLQNSIPLKGNSVIKKAIKI